MNPCFTHMFHGAMLSFLLLAGWPLAGCLGDRCSPDQILQEGACVKIAPDGQPDGQSDASVVDLDTSGLGSLCGESSDCSGEAGFCVVMPGKTTGYCTYRDCSIQENDCPAPYTCLDLSKYMPNLPTACLKI